MFSCCGIHGLLYRTGFFVSIALLVCLLDSYGISNSDYTTLYKDHLFTWNPVWVLFVCMRYRFFIMDHGNYLIVFDTDILRVRGLVFGVYYLFVYVFIRVFYTLRFLVIKTTTIEILLIT